MTSTMTPEQIKKQYFKVADGRNTDVYYFHCLKGAKAYCDDHESLDYGLIMLCDYKKKEIGDWGDYFEDEGSSVSPANLSKTIMTREQMIARISELETSCAAYSKEQEILFAVCDASSVEIVPVAMEETDCELLDIMTTFPGDFYDYLDAEGEIEEAIEKLQAICRGRKVRKDMDKILTEPTERVYTPVKPVLLSFGSGLSKKTMPELKAMCKKEGMRKYSKLNKSKLIALMEYHNSD